MSYKFTLTGDKELQKALLNRAKNKVIQAIVKRNTTQVQQQAMKNASSTYTKGYSTGATKKSIGIGFENGGLTGITGLGMAYNPYTEYGTRFMAAEPLLGPIFKRQKSVFISDIKKVVS